MEPVSSPSATPASSRGPDRAWVWMPVTHPLLGCLVMTAAGIIGTATGNAYLMYGGLGAATACGTVSLAAGFVVLASDYNRRLRRTPPLVTSHRRRPR